MKVYGIQILSLSLGYLIILTATISVFIKTVFFVGLNGWQVFLFSFGVFLSIGILQNLKHASYEKSWQPKEKIFKPVAMVTIFACSLGSLVTYYLNISRGLGPFMASGLVGIVVALIAPKFAPCVYSASFAAMSSVNMLPTIFHSIIIGLIVGIVFILCQRVFDGFGGELGVIAFFSVLLIFLVIKPEVEAARSPNLIQGLIIILSCKFSSIVTYLLSLRMKAGPVLASSIVTLTGGIFLPIIYPSIDEIIISALTAGSYVGMSAREIIPNKMCVGLAGVVAGVILALGVPVFSGLGGKLGVVAFIGVTCIWATKNLFFRKSYV